MILKARHHFLVYPFFRFYSGWIIHRHFGRVELTGKFTDRNLPVLLIANHFSWWDGFFALYVNGNIFRRKFHFMMLEEQLRKFRYLNLTGGFSVRKGSRSAVESINYTAELLGDQNNIVLLFPQGKIESAYIGSIQFESGIERILGKVKTPVQIVFMANLTDYFSERKPGLFMYLEEYKDLSQDASSIGWAYNRFYRECIAANALKSNE